MTLEKCTKLTNSLNKVISNGFVEEDKINEELARYYNPWLPAYITIAFLQSGSSAKSEFFLGLLVAAIYFEIEFNIKPKD